MKRFLASLVALAVTATVALGLTQSSVPTKFPIPWGNSAGVAFIRSIPTNSQIGIQNCAASLTDGFPPLTFQPATSGGCPPFGSDFNGILKQLSAWAQWAAAGGPIIYDATFQTAIGGYPKGAIIADPTTVGLLYISTIDNNTNAVPGTGWVAFSVGSSGVTPNTYTRAKITVDLQGRVTAASSGALPTYQSFGCPACTTTSTSGTATPSAGVLRWKVRMCGGGGGGGSTGQNGNNGAQTVLGGWTAAPGIGGSQSSAGSNLGGTGGANGTGTLITRTPGGAAAGGDNLAGGIGHTSAGGASAFGGTGAWCSGGEGRSATTPSSVGGSAGEYLEFVVGSPPALGFSVGAGGTSSQQAGTQGIILIEEFYD